MEKSNNRLVGVVLFFIPFVIFGGVYLIKQHLREQQIQRAMERQQRLESIPKGGPVGNLQDGIRWQD